MLSASGDPGALDAVARRYRLENGNSLGEKDEGAHKIYLPPSAWSSGGGQAPTRPTVKQILGQFPSMERVDKVPREITCAELQKDVLLLEEQEGSVNFKIGVMLMKPGQKTDDEMLSNEKGDEKWERFISLLGDKIRLRGWNRFRGGLDVKADVITSSAIRRLSGGAGAGGAAQRRTEHFLHVGQALKLNAVLRGDAPTSLVSSGCGGSRRAPWEGKVWRSTLPATPVCAERLAEGRLLLSTTSNPYILEGNEFLIDTTTQSKPEKRNNSRSATVGGCVRAARVSERADFRVGARVVAGAGPRRRGRGAGLYALPMTRLMRRRLGHAPATGLQRACLGLNCALL
ncbi:unnamed protein product [Chrysodeixis includens]|uniref:Rap-GAP domain-containing protein n=1 Tax=Chrysodeixis includens TaxID=689277 RepID=A0A9N8PZJ8_CHRIL|nr:unnamed protein product [Chrysodeixis includens]